MPTKSLIVITRRNANSAISAVPKGEPAGSVTSRCRARGRPWPSGSSVLAAQSGSRSLLSSRTQSTSRSRLVQIRPKRPPSRSTRAISGTARSGSIQCHAEETNTPSALVPGRGEVIPLPGASADGVFVSSAWHWMDPERAVPEIDRVLRDGGRFGLIWTSRDREADWVRELNRLLEPDWAARTEEPDGHGRPRARHREVTLPAGSPFGTAEIAEFAFRRVMTISDFVGMLGTYSGLITASPQERAAGLARVRAALEERFPG